MAQLVTLAGVEIKQPKPGDFGIEKYKLTNAGRVASGEMKMELVAKKTKLTFKYEILKGADLKTIADIVDGDTMFFEITYLDDNGEIKTITVYSGALKYTNNRSNQGIYWTNISFDLIQQ
jgi:hypothetical protein